MGEVRNRYGRGKTDGNRYMVKVLSVKTDGRGEKQIYGRGKTKIRKQIWERYMVKVLSVKTDGRGETKQPSGIGAHTYLREIE